MGGNLWLLFKSPKEASRAKAFLNPLGGAVNACGALVTLSWHGAMRVEISHSGARAYTLADMVGREMCRRFDIRRIGADSVGWFEKHTPPADCPGYTEWVEWFKDYKPEWSVIDLTQAQALSEGVAKVFEQLDGITAESA